MKTTRRSNHQPRGFLLLEVLLAMGVFAIAVTGFVIALQRTGDLAAATQRQLRVTRILESALTKAMSMPVLEESKESEDVAEMSNEAMQIETIVEPMEEKFQNEDGQFLQEMFRIQVVAHWFENGMPQEEMAETWRYSRLYQP
jgi:type II secretory pathway pseudopilin PulG